MVGISGSGLDSTKTIVDDGPLFSISTQPDPKVVHVVGFWRRSTAAVVDALVLLPVLLIAGWVGSRVAGMRSDEIGRLTVETLLDLFLNGGLAFYGTVALVLSVVTIYSVLFISTSGRTPGLMVAGAQVISVYGERPELWRVVVRCTGAAIGACLLGLGWIWTGIDREKRGLHDWLAGTYVVRHQKADQRG